MKKAVLLLLVAAAVGVAAFMGIANYFKQKQISTRIRDLGGMLNNVSGSTMTALDRTIWAGIMPPGDIDYPADEFVDGETHGRQEWFTRWQDLSSEGGGKLVRVVEDFKIEDPPTSSRYAGLDATTTTWTWHIGVPGEWGEKVPMRAIWVYEHQDYRIALLQAGPRREVPDSPPANPR
ncbi:MAG: hypothetical protein ACYTGX_01205 [Planctomycetota bacterium]|jgi:outer membrane murein-binding lipoprotein Lpp